MIAVDTNVLVRLVTNDDSAQSPRAAALFASSDVFLSKTVLLEAEWVLRHAYELNRATIMGVFERLLGTPSVSLEDDAAVRRAVEWFAAGMDFADALHLASASPSVTQFATFDRSFAKQAAKVKSATPVAVL